MRHRDGSAQSAGFMALKNLGLMPPQRVHATKRMLRKVVPLVRQQFGAQRAAA